MVIEIVDLLMKIAWYDFPYSFLRFFKYVYQRVPGLVNWHSHWSHGPLTVENVLEHVLWWHGCSSTQKIRPKVYAIWWTVSEPLIHRWEHLSILWHLHRKQELVCVNHEAFQAETKYPANFAKDLQLHSSIVIYLVSGFNMFQPLWKIWVRQLGWLFPIIWKVIKSHVPNHQPDIYIYIIYIYTVMLVYQRVAGIGAPHGPSHKFKARLGMKFRKKVKIPKTSLPVSYPWRIHGAAIYMVTWIPSIYPKC